MVNGVWGRTKDTRKTEMTKIMSLYRTRPSVHTLGQAHLGAAALPIRASNVRVTREEISTIFAHELGYSRHSI